MTTEPLKILLVDDQEDNLLAMEDLLEEINAEVYKTKSGQEALALVEQYDFATMLLDVAMPGMDGFEVARHIRENNKKDRLPIIFLTGQKSNPKMVFLGYESGGVDYMLKPVEPEILKSKVKIFLDLKAAQLALKHSNEALRESEGHKKAILESAVDCIINIDQEGRILDFNLAAEKTLGYSIGHARGKIMAGTIIAPSYRDEYRQALSGSLQTGKKTTAVRRLEVRVIHTSGQTFPVEMAISRISVKGPPLFSVFMHDISERKRSEQLIADQAIRDPLTGLYNRRYFNDQARQAISRSIRNNKAMALMFCDMDRFKSINDQRGHHTGDQVLKAVADNIQASVRGTDLAFRWGGDEFVVILLDATREGILRTFTRIRKMVLQTGREIHFNLDLSAGVAIYPKHGTDIDGLIRMADRALYRAKRGGDKIRIGEEAYHLDKHAIQVVFQPIFDISTGKTMGYEALGRIHHADLTIKQLFSRFESEGLLNEIKVLSFKSQIKAAEKIGLKRLFLNVDFAMLGKMEPFTKPENMDVIMEISEEEAVQDIDHRLNVAKNWRTRGYKFALDDFGVGFISLPFLATLSPDFIKVDRSIIVKAVDSHKFKHFFQDLLKAVQNYVHEGIIAEGIERDDELNIVKDMGIHLVQGYLLGKPKELTKP